MSTPSVIFANDALARHQKVQLDLIYDITGAKAGKFALGAPQVLAGYDAATFTQAAIDAALETSSEFLSATFGSTAMGTDAFAFVLNCDKQIQSVYAIQVAAVLGTTQAAQVGAPVALADTLPVNPRVQVSSLGNIGVQLVISGLDAATSGKILIRVLCDIK